MGSNPIAKTSPITKRVTEEIRVYTKEEHLNGVDKNTRDLYSEIKSAILTNTYTGRRCRGKKTYVCWAKVNCLLDGYSCACSIMLLSFSDNLLPSISLNCRALITAAPP